MRCLPEINSFLFFFGLRTGTKLIATLHMIVALVFTIMCGMLAEDFRQNLGTVEDEDGLYSFWYPVAVTICCISVAHTSLGLLLFMGAHKKRTLMVRMWVLIMCILWVLSVVVVIWMALALPESAVGWDLVSSIISAITFFGFVLYCIVTVNSYYLALKENEAFNEAASKPIAY